MREIVPQEGVLMSETFANRPLARAAVYFLVMAAVVLAMLILFLVRPEVVAEILDHPTLHTATIVVLTVIFALLSAVSLVLGFLSNCRPGRTVGSLALLALLGGVGTVVAMLAMG